MTVAWIIAFGLMLLIEGIIPLPLPLPLPLPRQWRQAVSRIIRFSDGHIRFFGAFSDSFRCYAGWRR
jgi:uncharacterized protein YjeT (DUF2065 family)